MQLFDSWPQNNSEWVASLRGQQGADQQRRSHATLAKYLYRVAYNYLCDRQADIAVLASFADDEISALAEEFVQDFMLKLTVNDFALLTKFHGTGTFTGFAAVILRRMIAKEFLKRNWTERTPWSAHWDETESTRPELTPETLTEQMHLESALEACLQTLAERERLVIVRALIEGYGVQEIAEQLGVSANTISIVLSRTKNKLRDCLGRYGFFP